MPLHDWSEQPGWEGMHHLWITELLRWVKPRLPAGYRAYIGAMPTVAVGAPPEKPDMGIRQWGNGPAKLSPEANTTPGANAPGSPSTEASYAQPDEEIAVATLESGKALYVEIQGRLIAALELISPGNKDRTVARATYLGRYVGYLLEGVHLLLIDVHRRPLAFSFADAIAQELQIRQPPCPTPLAVSYRVGEPAGLGGRLLAIWRRPLAVGNLLSKVILPLTVDLSVSIDLESTYAKAAGDVYLT